MLLLESAWIRYGPLRPRYPSPPTTNPPNLRGNSMAGPSAAAVVAEALCPWWKKPPSPRQVSSNLRPDAVDELPSRRQGTR